MKDNRTTIYSMDHSRGFRIQNLNGFALSIGIGSGHYCDNHDLGFDDTPYQSTATMEVAIIDENDEGGGTHFVVLPYDVAGHVPVGNLGSLIEAVESHDWERVLLLCGETAEPDYSKFPEKSQVNA